MLTKEVTKIMPTPNRIGMRLVLKDDGVDVVDKPYWEQFSPGDGATTKIKQSIGHRMQADIDEYKSRKVVYDAPAFDTAVTQVSDALTL